MDKLSCEVARDLLPLYCDGALSDESRALVEKHLAECGECAALHEQMKKDVAVRPAGDISVADALRGVQKALKRTRVKVIAIGLVVAVLLGWGGLTLWKELWVLEPVQKTPDSVKIIDLCQTSTGILLFHVALPDGFSCSGVSTKYDDGTAYVNFLRYAIPRKEQSMDLLNQWVTLSTTARDGLIGYNASSDDFPPSKPGQWRELVEIRIGSEQDYVTVWAKGTEIPPASEDAQRWYDSWMNMPAD